METGDNDSELNVAEYLEVTFTEENGRTSPPEKDRAPALLPSSTDLQNEPTPVKDNRVIQITCGHNTAFLFVSRLCQGSRGPCVWFHGLWLTPNEFQWVSGRECAKDWKRSIHHNRKSLKRLLANEDLPPVHPAECQCHRDHENPVYRHRRMKKVLANLRSICQHQYFNGSSSSVSGFVVQPATTCASFPSGPGLPRPEAGSFPNASLKLDLPGHEHPGQGRNMDSGLSLKRDARNSCPSPSLGEPKKESRLTSIIDRIRAVAQQPSSPVSPPFHLSPGGSDPAAAAGGGHLLRRPSSRNSSPANSDAESSLDETQQQPRIRGVSPSASSLAQARCLSSCSSRSSSRNSSSSGSDAPGGRGSRRRNRREREEAEEALPAGRDGPVTGELPGGGGRGQQPQAAAAAVVQSVGCDAARAGLVVPSSAMPTDALSVDPVPVVKSERFSPEVESSSPSVSPHSPSPARAFPGLHGGGGGRLLAIGAPSPAAVPFAAAATADRYSPALHAGSAPALKQMEMMTRNYSDFMRSLAAKYNNQNAQESLPFGGGQTNGILRGGGGLHDGPFKSSSPLQREPETRGKSSPPILLDQRLLPASCYGNLSDFSSSQTLLNLVRTASAQSASQLENYLRGAAKRSLHDESVPATANRTDPLDLSSKRLRMDSAAALDSLHGCRIPSPATAMRDLRDALLVQGLKLDPSDLLNGPLAELNAALRLSKSKGEVRQSRASSSATASKVSSPQGVQGSGRECLSPALPPPPPPSNPRCLSQCTDQSCSVKSEASEVHRWNVDDVVQFVSSLECCVEYAEKFREQSIDGTSLSLLSEDHLTSYFGMKLGPALRLKAAVAKRVGHCSVCMHCVHCHRDPAAAGFSANASAGASAPAPMLSIAGGGADSSAAPSSSSSLADEPSRSPPLGK